MHSIQAWRRWAGMVVVSCALTAGCGGGDDDDIAVSQVSYTSLSAAAPLQVPAELRLPPGDQLPAVVVVHGSPGIDRRGRLPMRRLNAATHTPGRFHIPPPNPAGIATLEIDMWTPRGVSGGANRPQGVPETLPDAYGALQFLAQHPRIDPQRIGIMGFSWGGVATMLTATKPYTDLYMGSTLQFKAHAPLYPVCWVYNQVPGYEFAAFSGAPVFLQGGELDTYDLPDTCPNLEQAVDATAPGVLDVTMYPNATHAFDRNEPEITVNDPIAHLGAGGEVVFRYNAEAAAQARAAVVAFFARTL